VDLRIVPAAFVLDEFEKLSVEVLEPSYSCVAVRSQTGLGGKRGRIALMEPRPVVLVGRRRRHVSTKWPVGPGAVGSSGSRDTVDTCQLVS
jgi:hypothetical protein